MAYEIILGILIGYFLISPIFTLFHELGHAVVPMVMGRVWKVGIGGDSGKTLKIGTGEIVFGNFLGNPFYGWADSDEKITKTSALFYLSGPLITVMLFLGLLLLSQSNLVTNSIAISCVVFLKYATGMQILFTLFPMRYPKWFFGYGGFKSDGLNFLQVLRSKKT